jgi:diguanylate cyclase (GGDEF)-like protein
VSTNQLRPGRNELWPVVFIGLLAMCVLVLFLTEFARRTDAATREREEMVVGNGLRASVEETARRVVPQTVWDEAVRRLDNAFDPAWAEDNIAKYLFTMNGFSHAYVLDRADRLVFAAFEGEVAPLASFDPLRSEVAGLIQKVRLAESERAATSAKDRQGLSEPIQASAIRRTPDDYLILTATLVQSDFGAARLKGPRAPIVITARPLDATFIRGLEARYMLTDAHLAAADTRQEYMEAHVFISDDRGEVLGTLDWTPQQPGANLLRSAFPWLLAFLGAILMLVAVLYRRATRAASSLIESEARATHMAHHDALTGIANRAWLEKRLSQVVPEIRRNGRSIAVHCIDLDGFKDLNDTHGHQAGDELLRAVAGRLKAQCREGDVCARLGGDEFAIVQVGADAAAAEHLAARTLAIFKQPFSLSSGTRQIGASIGVAVTGDSTLEGLELLRRGDLALYAAKDGGRGRWCFFEAEMDSAVRERSAMRDDLRAALNAGDLRMVYQAQVNRHDRIVGMEALVRWHHPERGPISPAIFVPLAEQAGLIADLGEYTVRRAFEDSRRWPGMKVAINISATHIRTPGFVAWIEALAQDCGVMPSSFEIELTEGVILNDDANVQKTLEALRELGFSLALDDFGTGYSSLSYLSRFPIDKIKIDRTFITNLGVDAEADAVVSAIVQLARALNLSVIAEGVETLEQRQRLLAIGCSEVQGFLTSIPMNAEDVGDTLDAGAHEAAA